MSHHENHSADQACNADSCYDAKSVIALLVIVVVTACFWLVGQ